MKFEVELIDGTIKTFNTLSEFEEYEETTSDEWADDVMIVWEREGYKEAMYYVDYLAIR